MIHPEHHFVIVRTGKRNSVMDLKKAVAFLGSDEGGWDAHLSICRYPQALYTHAQLNDGSARGFTGTAYADYVPFDLDGSSSLASARALAVTLRDQYDVHSRQMRISASGGGGYHLEVPTMLFGEIPPSEHFHLVLKHLALRVADAAGVRVDMARYARLALLRYPGSQHPARPPAGKGYAHKTVLGLSVLLGEDEDAHEERTRTGVHAETFRPGDIEPIPALAEIAASAEEAAGEDANRPPPEPVRERDEGIDVAMVAHELSVHYQRGLRRTIALGWGGWAAKEGVRLDDARAVMEVVASSDEDGGWKSIRRVEDSYAALGSGIQVAGHSWLKEALPDDVLGRLAPLVKAKPRSASVNGNGAHAEEQPGPRTVRDLVAGALEPLLVEMIEPKGATMLYGAGGLGKGMTVAWIIREMEKKGTRSLIFDAEGHPYEWRRRLAGLGSDLATVYVSPEELPKHLMGAPLHYVIPHLGNLALATGCGLIVIDSILASANLSEEGLKNNASAPYLCASALSAVGLPSILIGHTAKHQPDGDPYGSVSWVNAMRICWVGTPAGMEGDHAVRWQVKKKNERGSLRALRLTFRYDAAGSPISAEVSDDEVSTRDWITGILMQGPASTEDLVERMAAEADDMSERSMARIRELLRKSLARMKKMGKVHSVGKRPQEWALGSGRDF